MNNRDLAVVHPQHGGVSRPAEWTREDLNALKATVSKDITDAEFKVFLVAAQRLGLDPFARQVLPLKLQGRMTPQVTIDGFRLIAERSGLYAGQLGPFWCGVDGKWAEVWLDEKNPPAAAKVGVLRRDFEQPIWGVARYKSYVKDSPTWKQLPDVMLAKVAESLALRKAFPNELSGWYTPEELKQAQVEAQEEGDLRPPAATIVESDPPRGPAPASQTGAALTLPDVKARAGALGLAGAKWGALWNKHKGNLAAIAAELDALDPAQAEAAGDVRDPEVTFTEVYTPPEEIRADIAELCTALGLSAAFEIGQLRDEEQALTLLAELARRHDEAQRAQAATPPLHDQPVTKRGRG